MPAEEARSVPDYSQIWGNRNVVAIEIFGPASYATGGQVINASQFGMGSFDCVIACSRSYSGTYAIRDVQYMPVDAAPSLRKNAVSQISLPWYNVSDALEVTATTDLSTEIVRIIAIGL